MTENTPQAGTLPVGAEWSNLVISSQDLQSLAASGLPVVAPRGVPSRFHLSKVSAEGDEVFGSAYELLFQGPEGGFVRVQGCCGGIGDIFPGEERHAYRHPAFGDGEIEWYPGEDEPFEFSTPWLHGAEDFPVYGVSGRGLAPLEAVAVVESLRTLPEIAPA